MSSYELPAGKLPKRRSNSGTRQVLLDEFWDYHDSGKLPEIGQWVSTRSELHASKGHPGIVTGYTSDGFVLFALGGFKSHTTPKHLTVLTPREGAKLLSEWYDKRENAERARRIREIRATIRQFTGENTEATIWNLAAHIYEMSKRA